MPTVIVDHDGDGLRLDRFLRKVLQGMPSGHIFKLLRTRKVRINGKRAKAEQRLATGDEVLIHMPEDRFQADTSRPVRRATAMEFSVVHEDEHLLVVSKPPFLPVHPGAGHQDNSLIDQVHTYLEVQDRPSVFRPSLAHRLDRDTSGLVMIGKDVETVRTLSKMLKAGNISKKYVALAVGRPKPPSGLWELDVQRRDIPGAKRRDDKKHRESQGRTAYRVALTRKWQPTKKQTINLSLLVLTLLTGRTHQIRSHLLQVGHPLAGDRRYGDRELNRLFREQFELKRQFLHAYRLKLDHPINGKPLRLSAPYPHDLEPVVEHLRLGIPPS